MKLPIRVGVPLVGVAAIFAFGLTAAPLATADCVSSNGTTLCSQGDARGTDTGRGPGSGPMVPYPCEYDWTCDSGYGWNFGGYIGPW